MEDNKINESITKNERFNKWLDEVFDHNEIMGFKWNNLLRDVLKIN